MSYDRQLHRYDKYQDEFSSQQFQDNVLEVEICQLQEELNKTKAELKQYQTFYANFPSIHFTVDSEGIILTVDLFGATRLGYTIEELIQRTIFSIVHPEDRGKLQTNLGVLVENPTLVGNWELRQVCKDGSILWVKAIARVERETAANTIVLLVYENITERKQLEAELHRREQEVSDFIENGDKQIAMIKVYDNQKQFIGHYCFMKNMTASKQADEVLQKAHDELERRVEDRTAQLKQANAFLKEEIIERKRAQEALKKQTEREQLMWLISQRIRQSLNLEEILNSTVTEVREFLQADRVFVYRFDPDWSGVIVVESVKSDCKPILGAKIKDHCFGEMYVEPYKRGRIQATEDIYTGGLSQCHIDLLAQFEIRANLVVPILQGEQLWGLLVANHCREPRQWQQLEIDLLKQLATQVAIAIQQAEVYKQMQHQAQREQALNRFTSAIRKSLELEVIFATAVAEIGQLLQIDRVLIWQYLPQGKVWSTVADYQQSSGLSSDLGRSVPDPNNPLAERLKQLEVVKIHDTQNIEDEVNKSLADTHPGAWLLVPLHFQGNLWGSLTLSRSDSPYYWEDSEVELVCALAAQLAIAIQQSELYQQVQLLNTDLECQVQERTAQLQQALDFEAMLKRVTDKVRDSLDESQILQTAVRELTLVLGIDGCDTALYDADRTTATISYEYTPRIPGAKGHVVQMSSFPEGYRQLLRGEHFQFCELFPSHRGRLTRLACPIFDDRGVLGDIWLFKQQEEAFNEMEIRLVKQVANQCAIAIRQARLFQAAQVQVKELEKLNRLKDDFLSTISHELRTPVSSIKMTVQMLVILLDRNRYNYCEMVNPEAHFNQVDSCLKILHDECDREMSLINDLLDLQRLDAGTQPLERTIIRLQNWILHIVEPFEQLAQNNQQTLQIEIASELPPLVCDISSLGRVLVELLNNACKYTPPGEQIKVTACPKAGKIQLTISNSGVEIPANELPHIFDKFYRIPSSDPWKQSGTGLGLALIKKLTEHLSGKIWVESELGKTSFIVELPINFG